MEEIKQEKSKRKQLELQIKNEKIEQLHLKFKLEEEFMRKKNDYKKIYELENGIYKNYCNLLLTKENLMLKWKSNIEINETFFKIIKMK